jgi:uncharacterized membrane protein (DUF4010 family)
MFLQLDNSSPLLHPEATKIILTFFLSSLIGIEREEHKATVNQFVFGGIRTYPLIGLLGYALAVVSGPNLIPVSVGFAVIASFLWLSYQHKLHSGQPVGVTTEISGLTTFVVGVLVSLGHFWIAATLSVLSVLLLELKMFLESLSSRIPPQEIFTFTKFLFLTIVILPIVPHQDLGPFHINLFKTWLVVTAVSAISYGSYLLEVFTKGKGGMILSALLGGAYSSTLATVVLAKQAKEENSFHHLFSGSILMASGMMYLRLAILIGIFNRQLLEMLLWPLLLLGAIGLVGGWLWTRLPEEKSGQIKKEHVPRNPLELWVAFLFGGIFIGMLVLTELAVVHLGRRGVFGLAGVMGFTDVDPFVLSLTQSAGSLTTLAIAAASIMIATASNNTLKAVYAFIFADRKTGVQSLALLLAFAVLGLLPLFWLLAVRS